jgi:hypothetical protein
VKEEEAEGGAEEERLREQHFLRKTKRYTINTIISFLQSGSNKPV